MGLFSLRSPCSKQSSAGPLRNEDVVVLCGIVSKKVFLVMEVQFAL